MNPLSSAIHAAQIALAQAAAAALQAEYRPAEDLELAVAMCTLYWDVAPEKLRTTDRHEPIAWCRFTVWHLLATECGYTRQRLSAAFDREPKDITYGLAAVAARSLSCKDFARSLDTLRKSLRAASSVHAVPQETANREPRTVNPCFS